MGDMQQEANGKYVTVGDKGGMAQIRSLARQMLELSKAHSAAHRHSADEGGNQLAIAIALLIASMAEVAAPNAPRGVRINMVLAAITGNARALFKAGAGGELH